MFFRVLIFDITHECWFVRLILHLALDEVVGAQFHNLFEEIIGAFDVDVREARSHLQKVHEFLSGRNKLAVILVNADQFVNRNFGLFSEVAIIIILT